MYVPLPFPYCKQCRKKWPESYHATPGCNGLLEIDPDIKLVHCTNCNRTWDIWDSEYHCVCGAVFLAKEVQGAVEDLVEDCRLCAEELELLQSAYWKRRTLSKQSMRSFIEDMLNRLGYSAGQMAGYVVEKIIDFIIETFFK